MNQSVVRTRIGSFRVGWTKRGVARLELCRASLAPAGRLPEAWKTELLRYSYGAPVRWTLPLDLAAGTPFQRAVWRALRRIPHGAVRSYAWVAQQIGRPRAARAVGAACGANPIPVIIPCHRVVARDGSLGGFSAGLSWKKRLLALEKSGAQGSRWLSPRRKASRRKASRLQ